MERVRSSSPLLGRVLGERTRGQEAQRPASRGRVASGVEPSETPGPGQDWGVGIGGPRAPELGFLLPEASACTRCSTHVLCPERDASLGGPGSMSAPRGLGKID